MRDRTFAPEMPRERATSIGFPAPVCCTGFGYIERDRRSKKSGRLARSQPCASGSRHGPATTCVVVIRKIAARATVGGQDKNCRDGKADSFNRVGNAPRVVRHNNFSRQSTRGALPTRLNDAASISPEREVTSASSEIRRGLAVRVVRGRGSSRAWRTWAMFVRRCHWA